jgi:hypothetical protein
MGIYVDTHALTIGIYVDLDLHAMEERKLN